MNNLSNKTLYTKAKYRDISSVEYKPIKKHRLYLSREPGKTYFWKLLGFIPLIPYKVSERKYESWFCEGYRTIDEWLEYLGSERYLLIDGELYEKASVSIYNVDERLVDRKYFSTNVEAENFIDNLKIKCEEAGNQLE